MHSRRSSTNLSRPHLTLFLVPLLLLLAHPNSIGAQTGQPSSDLTGLQGTWDGRIDIPGQPLHVILHFTALRDSLSGTADIPDQSLKGATLGNIRWKPLAGRGDSLECSILDIPGEPTFHGIVEPASSAEGEPIYHGLFAQAGVRLIFKLTRTSALAGGESDSSTLDSLTTWYDRSRIAWGVPGMAVAIVKDGKIVLTKGFGVRDLESKQPVTEHTLFPIGSSTKAFTSTLMATLVSDGKVEWKKPVRTYLPDFELKDPIATQTLTVRDILTHESGLPRHDLLWYGSDLNRDELYHRLQYLEPDAAPRERWQYQNLMFLTAGLLEERVTGDRWEDLLLHRILQPLGMTATNTSISALRATTDHATGYALLDEDARPEDADLQKLSALPYRDLSNIAPAGAINSNALDMARWLEFNLEGVRSGKEVQVKIDPQALREVQSPQVVVDRRAQTGGGPELLFDLYGMGWMIHSYRGHDVVEHGGNIDGFTAQVGLLPGENLGVVILSNRNDSPLPQLAMWETFDRLLHAGDKDWSASARGRLDMVSNAVSESMTEHAHTEDLTRIPNTHPSHPLKSYAGDYRNAAYGEMQITADVQHRDTTLMLHFRDVAVPLRHFHYDVFEGVTDTMLGKSPGTAMMRSVLGGLKIQFHSDISGRIADLAAPLEPAVSAIVFDRQAPAELQSAEYLSRFVGTYAFSSTPTTVSLQGNRLQLTVPGQPTYTLEPLDNNTFSLHGLHGYTAEFLEENGKVTGMLAIQPNGTFEAKKEAK